MQRNRTSAKARFTDGHTAQDRIALPKIGAPDQLSLIRPCDFIVSIWSTCVRKTRRRQATRCIKARRVPAARILRALRPRAQFWSGDGRSCSQAPSGGAVCVTRQGTTSAPPPRAPDASSICTSRRHSSAGGGADISQTRCHSLNPLRQRRGKGRSGPNVKFLPR
jgi:hypothetical protein